MMISKRHGMGIMKLGLTSLGLCLFALPVVAEESPAELISLLDELTQVATRTRLNVDYVPGILTVLRRVDLEPLGVQTVWEAMSLVPGFDPVQDKVGDKQLLVRGGSPIFNSGNLKYLLNGMELNALLNAEAPTLLDLPIRDVERIEVIRGPGSAVYGEFAYQGVVNVITREEGNEIGVVGGSGGHQGGWARAALTPEKEGGLATSLGVSYRQSDHSAHVDADGFMTEGLPHLSSAPGDTNALFRYRSLIYDLQKNGFRFQAGGMEMEKGDHFGINYYLPPDSGLVDRHRTLHAEGGYTFQASDDTELGMTLGWRRNNRLRDDLYLGNFDTFQMGDRDYYMDHDYGEEKWNAKVQATYRGFSRHTLFGEASWSHARILDASWESDPILGLSPSWIDPDMARTVRSFVAQDEFALLDSVTLTTGVRYDTYDDVGDRLSPRIAAVWRVDPNNILKLQYGEAFRPPTFYEMRFKSDQFGSGDISPDTSRSLEFGYIHRRGESTTRLTLYATRLEDLIFFDFNQGYINNKGSRLAGAELEWDWHLTKSWRLLGNAGVFRNEILEKSLDLAAGVESLGNLALLWSPSEEYTLGTWWHHVGHRGRAINDPRSELDGSDTLDLTGTVNGVAGVKGLTLQASVRNLFDGEVLHPSPYEAGTTTYLKDFPQSGREFWLEMRFGW